MSANQNPPKRPRLSLQIKAISSGPNLRASRTIAAVVNPTSPTSFNTLSNVYATAIDRSTPVTAINTKQPLKIHTQNLAQSHTPYGAPTPFPSTYPETPLTAQPISPAVAGLQEVPFPSTMTATPPLSAGPVDSNDPKPFLFAPADTISSSTTSRSATTATTTTTTTSAPTSAGANASAVRRRATAPLTVPNRPAGPLPYMRNRSLHSILRNSPLPPPTAKTPTSPRRQSQRLAEKAARRVGYESPIERVIVTNRYVESPIDLLLADDGSNSGGGSPASVSVAAAVLALPSSQSAVSSSSSPSSPSSPSLDHILDRTSDETRDGGMTPGPFEEIRRRMAGLVTRTPTSPAAGSPAGVRKRRKRETKRRWVWTIGTLDDEEEEGEEAEVGGAIAAMRAAARVQTQTHGETLSLSAVTTGTTSSSTSSSSNNNSSNSLPPVTVDLPVVLSPMDILTPSVETFEQVPDVVMSEPEAEAETVRVVERRALSLTPGDMMDIDMVTPTVARGSHRGHLEPTAPRSTRQDSEGLFNPETGSRRDTPVPADLVATA